MHAGDLARGCSDLEMTCLLCCAGAATDFKQEQRPIGTMLEIVYSRTVLVCRKKLPMGVYPP